MRRLGLGVALLMGLLLLGTTQSAFAADDASLAATWQYRTLVVQAANQYDVPAGLIQAVMAVESSGNPNALSYAGAIGLMQVMPDHFSAGANPWDPATNILMGASILRGCEDAAGGWHPGDDWVPAINCYLTGQVSYGWTSYAANVRASWETLASQGA